MAVDGVFFWLAGVGGDGQQRAVNNGGGDVQRTMEKAMCSEQWRRRRAANDAGDVGERREAFGWTAGGGC